MKGPVRYSGGRLKYTGRVPRERFATWAESDRGRTVLEQVASRTPFTLFGRMRAARRQVWRQLIEAARSEAAVAAVQREVEAHLTHLETLVYAHELPRVAIDLHRLIVVPRLLLNAETYRRLDAALEAQSVFAAVDGSESLRGWFLLTLVEALEAAVVDARPSPWRPLPAGEGWITVGVNQPFEWRIPFEGPAWPGHYYVLELTRAPLKRAFRKAAGEAVAHLEASLPSLSRVQRNEILRQAESSLAGPSVRAS